MNLLSQHIEYLLIKKDCVILPDFGAFIVSHHSAEINEESGFITPPYKSISFNPEVTNDDGLLAHSIARKYKLNFEESRQKMERLINELNLQLAEKGEFMIGNIGLIKLNEIGKPIFEPYMNRNRREFILGQPNVSIVSQNVDTIASIGDIPTNRETIYIDSINRKKYYYIRLPKTMVRIAAVIAIVVTGCLMFALPVSDSNTTFHPSMASVLPLTDQTDSKCEIESDTHVSIEQIEAPASSKVCEQSHESKYYLIVGTFANREGAAKYISQHPGEGLTVQEGRSGICRVAAEKSDSRSDLQMLMNQPAFRSQYPESWIWEK